MVAIKVSLGVALLFFGHLVGGRAVTRTGLLPRQEGRDNATSATNSTIEASPVSNPPSAASTGTANLVEQCAGSAACSAFIKAQNTSSICDMDLTLMAGRCRSECPSGDVVGAMREGIQYCSGSQSKCMRMGLQYSYLMDNVPACAGVQPPPCDGCACGGRGCIEQLLLCPAQNAPPDGSIPAPVYTSDGLPVICQSSFGNVPQSLQCRAACSTVASILASSNPCDKRILDAKKDCSSCFLMTRGNVVNIQPEDDNEFKSQMVSYCQSRQLPFLDAVSALPSSAPAQPAALSVSPQAANPASAVDSTSSSNTASADTASSASPPSPPSSEPTSLVVLSTSTRSDGALVTRTATYAADIVLSTSTASNGDVFTLTSILPQAPSVSLADVTDVSGRVANTAVAAATPTQTSAAGRTPAVKGGAVLAAVLMAVIVL